MGGSLRIRTAFWAASIAAFFVAGCADQEASPCRKTALDIGAGSRGEAQLFGVDPATGSGSATVSPSTLDLNPFTFAKPLTDLTGKGVLSGTWVDVRTNQDGNCRESYGLFSNSQNFKVPYSDPGFQESMVYFYTNLIRQDLAQKGFLTAGSPRASLRAIANCESMDNAYYLNGRDSAGNPVEFLCFGKSTSGPQRNYADDGMVIVHEAQHAHTQQQYSSTYDLNALLFDDAGAINEAVSDFMALYYARPFTAPSMDPRVFSRWALGLFFPSSPGRRGAHGCPEYDDRFPNCSDLNQFGANGVNHISYKYPDGLGWPYTFRTTTSGKVAEVFQSHGFQEQIHSNAPMLVGALWDLATAVEFDSRLPSLVQKTIAALPKPSNDSVSPVTWPGFADKWMQEAEATGFGANDLQRMEQAFQSRGLRSIERLGESWAAIPALQSVKIEDHAVRVKQWIQSLGGDANRVKNSLVKSDGVLDADETAAVWFNIQNSGLATAGSVELTVRSLGPSVHLMGLIANWGYLGNDRAQIRYSKINGTRVVQRLSSPDPTRHVPTGNTYFLTNPAFSRSLRTALWVVADPTVASGTIAQFEVRIRAANAPIQTLVFQVPVRGSNG